MPVAAATGATGQILGRRQIKVFPIDAGGGSRPWSYQGLSMHKTFFLNMLSLIKFRFLLLNFSSKCRQLALVLRVRASSARNSISTIKPFFASLDYLRRSRGRLFLNSLTWQNIHARLQRPFHPHLKLLETSFGELPRPSSLFSAPLLHPRSKGLGQVCAHIPSNTNQ